MGAGLTASAPELRLIPVPPIRRFAGLFIGLSQFVGPISKAGADLKDEAETLRWVPSGACQVRLSNLIFVSQFRGFKASVTERMGASLWKPH